MEKNCDQKNDKRQDKYNKHRLYTTAIMSNLQILKDRTKIQIMIANKLRRDSHT